AAFGRRRAPARPAASRGAAAFAATGPGFGLAKALAKVDAPANLRIAGAVEVDRPLIDSEQRAVRRARHTIGKSRLNLGSQQREAIRRVIALVAVVIDGKAQPLDHRNLPVEPQLESPPPFGEQEGVTSGGCRDQPRLPGRKV